MHQLSNYVDRAKSRFLSWENVYFWKGKYFQFIFLSVFFPPTHTLSESAKGFYAHFISFWKAFDGNSLWKWKIGIRKTKEREPRKGRKKTELIKEVAATWCVFLSFAVFFFCFHHNFLVDQEIAKDKMGDSYIMFGALKRTSGRKPHEVLCAVGFLNSCRIDWWI